MKEPLATSLEASKLPVEFVNFLKSNMNGIRGNYTGFLRYLHSYPYLDALVAESFRDIDSLGRTDVLFKSLGWEGIRHRLFEVYFTKKHINSVVASLSDSLKKIEIKFAPFSVDGYSRHLILFFYINTLPVENKISNKLNSFLLASETLDYLRFFKKRILKLDLLLLVLFLFESYIGRDDLIVALESGLYDTLYLQLNNTQQHDYFEVLLHYSYSIGDDLFLEDRV